MYATLLHCVVIISEKKEYFFRINLFLTQIDKIGAYLCINKKKEHAMSKEVNELIASSVELEDLIADLDLEFVSAEEC